MVQEYTRRQSILHCLGSLALTAVAGYWLREGENALVGWFFVAFFGLGAALFGFLAITGRPYLVRPEEWSVVLEPGGFAVVTTKGRRRSMVRWDRVRRVVAYKRDLFTVDEICLVFVLDDAEKPLEVSEEWQGFADLFGPMEKELGVTPGWYMEIMTPVFEPTPRLLFSRGSAAPAAAGKAER